MEKLDIAQRELVALGAAMGSNCVPCIEYHIPQARKADLTDEQIGEAISIADQVRKVPAQKVLAAAVGLLETRTEAAAEQVGSVCGDPQPDVAAEEAPCCV